MNERQIKMLAESKKVVTEIFEQKVNPLFVFHTLEHTRQVAKAVEVIAGFYHFSEDDKFILLLSAWFHDTGFSAGHIEGHEVESIKIAANFLQHHNADKEVVSQVACCIQSTQMPQRPLSGIDKIISDSDLFHLGTTDFNKRTALLKQELQFYYQTEFTDKEWSLRNIEFLKSHNYFTGYCQQKLEPVKQQWITQLQRKAIA